MIPASPAESTFTDRPIERAQASHLEAPGGAVRALALRQVALVRAGERGLVVSRRNPTGA
jgi:hypothetical protein